MSSQVSPIEYESSLSGLTNFQLPVEVADVFNDICEQSPFTEVTDITRFADFVKSMTDDYAKPEPEGSEDQEPTRFRLPEDQFKFFVDRCIDEYRKIEEADTDQFYALIGDYFVDAHRVEATSWWSVTPHKLKEAGFVSVRSLYVGFRVGQTAVQPSNT